MTPTGKSETIEKLCARLDREDGLAAQIVTTIARLGKIPDDDDHAEERAEVTAKLTKLQQEEEKVAAQLGKQLSDEIKKLEDSLVNDLKSRLAPLSLEDANENELSSKDRLSDCAKVSLQDEGFLDNARKLDSIVSYEHILEEMDSRTYLERVNGELARLKETGHKMRGSIRTSVGKVKKLRERRDERRRQLRLAHEACRKRGVAVMGADRLDDPAPEFEAILNVLETYEERLNGPLAQFTGPRNKDYIRKMTTYAAKAAEQGLLPSVLAGANSVVAVLLLKYGITNSGSLLLLENQTALIATAALVAYVGALWVGKRNRKRRIDHLNARMMTALRSVFEIGATEQTTGANALRKNWLVRNLWGAIHYIIGLRFTDPAGTSDNKDLFVFPKINLGQYFQVLQKQSTQSRPDKRGMSPQVFAEAAVSVVSRDVKERWWVGGKSLLIALVSALLPVAPVLLTGDQVTHLVGRTVDGERCILASGPIVRATPANLHIAKAGQAGPLERFFPSFPAQSIDRQAIVEIKHHPVDSKKLQNCDDRAIEIREASVEKRRPNLSFLENFGRYLHVTNHQHGPALDATARAQIDAIHASVTAPQTQSTVHVVNPNFTVTAPKGQTVNYVLKLYVDGQHIDGGPRKNSMLFPLFRNPVKGIPHFKKEEDYKRVVYKHGRDSLKPGSDDGVRNLAMLKTAFLPLLDCLEPGSILELDVMAFASNKWHSPGAFEPSDLNHVLAEGRRAAVLDVLAVLLDDSGRQGKILIHDASKGDAVLLRNLREGTKVPSRFAGPKEMREALRNWVADDGGEVVKGQIKELLERSVVVRLIEITGSTCEAESVVVGDVVAAAKAAPTVE